MFSRRLPRFIFIYFFKILLLGFCFWSTEGEYEEGSWPISVCKFLTTGLGILHVLWVGLGLNPAQVVLVLSLTFCTIHLQVLGPALK